MNKLTKFYNNNDVLDNIESLYLYFGIGECNYAINIQHVVEIMKLPMLDYPQKLANNVVGLLNYNNFTINVLDLRFYLDVNVTPYSVSNQLLIVKTDETLFGIIIDKVGDIISLNMSKVEYFSFQGEERIIEFLYKQENDTISVINLNTVENVIKRGVEPIDFDISTLFPQDDTFRYKLMQRSQALVEKSQMNLASNMFSQDKFISFALDECTYCINIEYVREFLKNCPITKIPCNLDYVAGVITLRGDFVSVIDAKKFLEFENYVSNVDYTEGKNSVIVLETPDFKIGFLVDEIFSIVDIPEESIDKSSYKQSKYILSEIVLNDNLYILLNMKNILSDERFFVEDN